MRNKYWELISTVPKEYDMDRQKLINLVKTNTNFFEDYPFNKKIVTKKSFGQL